MVSLTLEMALTRAGSEMSAIRTEAPSRANRIVVSRPIPLGEESRHQRPDQQHTDKYITVPIPSSKRLAEKTTWTTVVGDGSQLNLMFGLMTR